jgi:tetratricopeptide (TPR) repeat protein
LLYERARLANNKAGFDEAIGQLRRALALDAESMAAYQILASIYYTTAEADRSKLRLAQLVCDEAKKINPDYAPRSTIRLDSSSSVVRTLLVR